MKKHVEVGRWTLKNRLKKLIGEDNIAGLLDEAAAIMNNADAVLAGAEVAEVVA